MAEMQATVTQRTAWKALEAHYQKVRDLHLPDAIPEDPLRGERMTAEAIGIYLDYSKNRITGETLGILLQLAEDPDCGLASMPCSEGRRSTSRKSAPFCTWPCAPPRANPSSWTERTSPCSGACRPR